MQTKWIFQNERQGKYMSKHTITIAEVNKFMEKGVSTFSLKDDSPRGCKTVPVSEIKVGDEIVIDNYFAEVIE